MQHFFEGRIFPLYVKHQNVVGYRNAYNMYAKTHFTTQPLFISIMNTLNKYGSLVLVNREMTLSYFINRTCIYIEQLRWAKSIRYAILLPIF